MPWFLSYNRRPGYQKLQLETEKVQSEIQKAKFDIVIWVAGLLIASGVYSIF